MNHFAKNLAYLLKRFGVTQTELGLHLDRGQSTVGGWANKVSEPNVEALIGISDFFGISIDHLIRTDLGNGKLITDDHVEEFKKYGKVRWKVNGKDKPVYRGFDEDRDSRKSVVNEHDPAKDWAFTRILQSMDGKLDKLLILADNKAKR